MMKAYLLDKGGGRLDLPPLVAWSLKRTSAVPCDSFEGTVPWDGGLDPVATENPGTAGRLPVRATSMP